mgnify:CR=1 FL=1
MAIGATAELEAGLSRIVRLAEEHAYALDPCARAMTASAWVGGGAPRFTEALVQRRNGLQQAFNTAVHTVAEQIRRLGGQASAPQFASTLGVASAAPGSFSGMDIAVMTRLVADLDRAGRELPLAGQRLAEELSAAGVTAIPGRQVADIGTWAQQQAADLRRRLAMLQKQYPTGVASQASAGFGLFGGHAPDPEGVGALTAAAAAGDVRALRELHKLQESGKDAALAARLNVWWQQLDEQTRDRLIAAAPGLVGGLNGLPSAVRDQANRRHLEAQRKAVAAELARLRASAADAEERIEELELIMRQIAAVDRALALSRQANRPPAFLLDLRLGKDGKAAISFGNPDEADNVVTYVPGTGTTLEGFAGDAKRAAATWDQANFFAEPGKKVASIAWLGYDAPLWEKTLSGDRTVLNMHAALAGAPKLASFTDGLHAAHRPGANVRLTVLGHSYGSTVVGLAARIRPGTFADQVIVVGSPGVGALKAEDLGVESVWVGEAPNDPVGDIGSLPHLKDLGTLVFFGPLALTATYIAEKATNTTGTLGPDPSSKEFGARHFYVPDSRDPFYTFKGHSSYWDTGPAPQDSASLVNIARLVNGQYDKLVRDPIAATVKPSPMPLPSPSPAGDGPADGNPVVPRTSPGTPSPTPRPAPPPAGG